MGGSALATLQSRQPAPVQAILTSLVNDLNSLEADAALVLDDYHVITAAPVHAALQFLLETMPARMHLVLLTRADPPLPLARLRARDQLTEIRLPALRFQPEEAGQFLNEVMCLGLSFADITALESRTEGWIAGLQLAAVSLQQHVDRHAFVAAFAGDDRYVMDYLLEEVLQRQSPEVQSFLLKTSILERLNESLCRAVTGQMECQSILTDLEQANLFVTPLDSKRYWYRYHPLFADLLRHRLRQLFPPAEWMQFYKNACEWYEFERSHLGGRLAGIRLSRSGTGGGCVGTACIDRLLPRRDHAGPSLAADPAGGRGCGSGPYYAPCTPIRSRTQASSRKTS